MNEILRMLVLIILALAGITKFQAWKTKDLKQEARKAQDAVKQKEKEILKLNEVQQKITKITQEKPPVEVAPPASGDAPDRLARLNRLHDNTNSGPR